MSDDSIMSSGWTPTTRPDTGARLDPTAQAAAFAERLLAEQTPQQAAIAARIYARLKAGAELEDIRGLIEDLCDTHGQASPERPVESAAWSNEMRLYEDVDE